MRLPLFLALAAVLSSVMAYAADPNGEAPVGEVPMGEAIPKLEAAKQKVLDQHLKEISREAERDEARKKHFDKINAEYYSKQFVNAVHRSVVDKLKASGRKTVTEKEIDVYDDAFRDELRIIREAMRKGVPKEGAEGGDRRAPYRDFKQILAETQPQRHELPGLYGENDPKEVVPVLDGQVEDYFLKRAKEKKPGGASGGSGTSFEAGNHLAFGDMDGAKQALDAAAQSGQADSGAYALRASMALDAGQFSAAANDARQALEMDPNNREARVVLQFSQGRVEAGGATEAMAAGAEASVPSLQAASPGGSASAGVSAAALSASSSRVSMEQVSSQARRMLALGDAAGALSLVNRTLIGAPGDPTLLLMRAGIYGRQRQFDKSSEDAAAGLARLPKNPDLLRTKAYADLRGGRYKDVLSASAQILELDPNNALAYAYRAHAYGNLGDRDAMLADIRRAAQLDPRFAKNAAEAEALMLPSNSDVLFLFPGEAGPQTSAVPASGKRGRRFGVLMGVSLLGGILLALGLLQTVLAPIKDQVVSVFTRLTRAGPSLGPVEAAAVDRNGVGARPTALIRGQYEVSRQIGAGGMGMVYEGTDRSLGRRVAIKKMREEIRCDARERARFIAEAKTVAALHHPAIVDIYAIAEDGEDVFLVFEYVDGKTVHDLVQARGGLEPALAARVVREVSSALDFAHSRGIIHRDMKPSNVMVDAQGRVKVMDFGIARVAKDAMTRYSVTNTVVGTPPYMAPEQEQGQVRRESDVYALAVCAYEMLTGKLPFAGTGGGMMLNKINMSYVPPSRQKEGLPAALDAVFEKAFQADPEKRHRSPAEFSSAFQAGVAAVARARA